MRAGPLLALLGAAACAPRHRPPAPAAAPPAAAAPGLEAAAGVRDPRLAAVLRAHWDATMARWPTFATAIGDHRFDDRLPDPSAEAEAAFAALEDALLEQALAIDPAALHPDDALTRALFVDELRRAASTRVCRFGDWSVSPRDNALVIAFGLPDDHPLAGPDDAARLLRRLEALGPAVDAAAARLRAGAEAGRVAPAETLRRTVEQLDAALLDPAPLRALSARAVPGLDGDAAAAWSAAVAAVVDAGALPALGRYRDTLRDDILPRGRPEPQAGVRFIPDGDACYAALVQSYTTLPLTAEMVHLSGKLAIASVHAELRALGPRAVGEGDLQALFTRLREDPELRFSTEAEVEAHARAALAAAEAAAPRAFGRLPATRCEVRPIPAHEAPFTTIAYYKQAVPGPQGTPGIYYINTWAPESRPRFEASALAFHESVPGHHLQIAVARELPDLPAFRRYQDATAFVEGWALYTERLADELGLYATDLDRLGMLSFDAWRSARLVVDTGIHHQGWTRAQAEAWMLENTPLAANNIRNEVDRYISTPGQALSYKTGQIEILALRAQAQAALGPAFSLPAFHDHLLSAGALPLPALRARMEAWIAAQLPPEAP